MEAVFFFLLASLNIPVINAFNGNPAVTNIKFIVVLKKLLRLLDFPLANGDDQIPQNISALTPEISC